MRHICLFLFSFLFCKASFAKEPVNANPGTDTAAIIRLFHTGDTILNADSAIVFCNRILKLSEEANYANGAFAALMSKGIKYSEKEDFVTSRDCYLQAMQYAPKANRKDAVAWCYNNIGTTYASEGDYTLASQYFYNTLQEFKKTGAPPTSALVNAYNNLAAINMRLNQVDKAFSYYNQAEEIARKGKFNFQLASILLDKGLYCISIHKPDSALMYFNEVMDIGKNINKVDLQATANLDIGQTFIEMGKYEKAIPYLRQSIALAENRFYETVLGAKYVLGDAYYRMRKYKDAETILLSVIKEMTSHNLKDMYLDGYGKLISVYKATGQYKKALDYTDTLAILKDSLTSTEKTKAINLMDVKYKTAEKDKEIAQNQLLIAQQKNKLTNRNLWIIYIITGVFLLTLLLLFIYRTSKHKERLQTEQIKTLQNESTIGVLKGVVQGEENERTRIARELHDGIGGMLSAAMMRFRAIRHDNETITGIPAYSEAMQLLDEMGDEIRKTAHNLMPEVLLKQTLPEAVSSYCNSVREEGSLQIDFQSFGTFDTLSQNFKLNVYRIIQELLKNITEHAKATHALVQLVKNKNILTITVEDNGIGFNTGETKDGIGLYNLQTRVRSLYGHYTLESEVNKGTSVFIEFDLDNITETKTT